jgi:hypothetical protein
VRIPKRRTVKSPLLFPSLDAPSFGLDRAALRDRNRCPLIPEDQVRGVTLQAVEEMAAETGNDALAGLTTTVFGRASDQWGYSPNRSWLTLTDLVGPTCSPPRRR